MSRAKVGSSYKHYRNGETYLVVGTIRLKYDKVWVDGIIYQNSEGMEFCRPREIFEKKFTLVKN